MGILSVNTTKRPPRVYVVTRGFPWFYKTMEVTANDLRRYYTDEAIQKFREDGYLEPKEKCCGRCDGVNEICVIHEYSD